MLSARTLSPFKTNKRSETMISIPGEIRNTLEWLIKIEEFKLARDLALTISRFLPQEHPETSDFLAMVFHRTKHYREALQQAQKTVSLMPDQIEARYNLARCLHSTGEAALAEEQILRVLKTRPDWLEPQLDHAMYICAQGRFNEAEDLLLRLHKKFPPDDPHQSVIEFNLAWHQIRHGQLKEGLGALSIGRKIRAYGNEARTYAKPPLERGASVSGKKILIVGEAGAGDEIINVRFAQIIRNRGGICIWVTGQKMESLFSRVEGVEKVVSPAEVPNLSYDFWTPAMDLFSTLDLDAKDISSKAYLQADPKFLTKWKTKIKDTGKLKVGLRWQGNPHYEQDLYRSVPFPLFRDFLKMEGVDFYSLQRDSGVEELVAADPVLDLSKDLATWEDTAAAISLLDVVVTSCTSIAHLAGALGKQTLVFTPMLSYYIWAAPGEKSLWYPNVKLYRQQRFHDWRLEAGEIFAEIQRQAGSP
jgi:tetratricopeptide (TPR) repeat protein